MAPPITTMSSVFDLRDLLVTFEKRLPLEAYDLLERPDLLLTTVALVAYGYINPVTVFYTLSMFSSVSCLSSY